MRRTFLAFGLVASLASFAGLLLANGMMWEDARTSLPRISARGFGNDTYVLAQLLVAPGDLVRIQNPDAADTSFEPAPEGGLRWHLSGSRVAWPVELYVLEGGEGARVAEGGAPENPLYHAEDAYAAPAVLDVVRPEPSGPKREVLSLLGEPAFAVNEDVTNAVDVLWVVKGREISCDPALVECDRQLEEFRSRLASTPHRRPAVLGIDGDAPAKQAAYYVAEAAAGLAALGFAGALVAGMARRRRPAPSPEEPTASLLAVARRAVDYLVSLRALLLAVGLVLAALAFLGSLALEEIVFYAHHLRPSVAWHLVLTYGLVGTFFALALAWALTLLMVQRELSRVRRGLEETPWEP